ncbi:MAG TPA: pantoate--beta-alanine ligase [Nocardioides sp.]|nr:pantoate--beta-alanine ligase [Nocardioides sp.]
MSRAPTLASTRDELSATLAPHRRAGSTVGVVTTMGALHDGHASLFRAARERVGEGPVVATVFVNPLQFGVGEDLDRYPRTLGADLEICEREGVDVVFAPGVEEVYPGGDPDVTVEPGPLGDELEGASRPGHFRGVLTVVAKLFGLVRPDVAVFGEKDYQQLVLIRQLSRDLCLGVDVVGAETVREPDGLALSSRNRYLDPDERRRAVVLSQALRAAQDRAAYGLPAARWAAMCVLDEVPESELDLDYLEIRTPELATVAEPHPLQPTPARILVAARVGSTRLIDNLPLVLGGATLPATHVTPVSQ